MYVNHSILDFTTLLVPMKTERLHRVFKKKSLIGPGDEKNEYD
jgi:hypothetical protein